MTTKYRIKAKERYSTSGLSGSDELRWYRAAGYPCFTVTGASEGKFTISSGIFRGWWVYRDEVEVDLESYDHDKITFTVKYGDFIAYQGGDKSKTDKVFDLLKETKKSAKDIGTKVSILVEA